MTVRASSFSAVGAISSERSSPDANEVRATARFRTVTSPAILLLLTACTTLNLESRAPEGLNLNGTWLLVEEASETPPTHRRLRSRGGMLAFITQDFPVLRAREMRIEQSRDSMGIRYDTGDYRDVSWGTRQRGLWEVRAGWHEGSLYILSDASDARAREIVTLSEDGRRLDVRVRVDSGGDDVDVTRVFRRGEGANSGERS